MITSIFTSHSDHIELNTVGRMERHSEQMQSLEDEVEGNERNGLLGGMDNEEIVGGKYFRTIILWRAKGTLIERRKLLFRLGFSFFIFGLINNGTVLTHGHKLLLPTHNHFCQFSTSLSCPPH